MKVREVKGWMMAPSNTPQTMFYKAQCQAAFSDAAKESEITALSGRN